MNRKIFRQPHYQRMKMGGIESRKDERQIVLSESWDNEHAIIQTRELAAGAGFSQTDQTMISTAASELSTNILRYAGKGELLLKVIHDQDRTGIEILAVDNGPGIENLERAMEDHYTTTRGSLGLGLSSVRRIMDDFQIESSPGKGTRVTAHKWRHHGQD